MPRPKTPELLTPKEVAGILKVGKPVVYYYIRTGRFPAGRLPGSRLLRVKRKDLNRYIAEIFRASEPEA